MRKKQNANIPATGPTPLDEIRQAEARSASQLFHAQQEAQARKQAAKKQADQVVQQARQAGAQAGQIHSEELIAESRRQAEKMVADAHLQANLLASLGQEHIQDAIRWAVQYVLGTDAKDGSHDS